MFRAPTATKRTHEASVQAVRRRAWRIDTVRGMPARSGNAQLAYECVDDPNGVDVFLIHAGVPIAAVGNTWSTRLVLGIDVSAMTRAATARPCMSPRTDGRRSRNGTRVAPAVRTRPAPDIPSDTWSDAVRSVVSLLGPSVDLRAQLQPTSPQMDLFRPVTTRYNQAFSCNSALSDA